MKKNIQSLICAAIFFMFCTPAAAAGYYMGILGGIDLLPDAQGTDAEGSMNFSYDSGYDGGITVGYDLGDKYPKIGKGRVELEFNTASADLNEAEFVEGTVGVDGSVKRTSIMLNTIGEYTTQSGMIVYALLGLGWAQISLDNVSILGTPFVDDSDSQLAYQAGLGVGWRFSQHFVFDLSYRYYGTLDPEFSEADGTSLTYEYTCHRILAGLRVNF
jgi:opacity protein-like surface antigen